MPDTEQHALTAAADRLLALDKDPALPLTPQQRATLRRFAQRLHAWANSPTSPTRVPAGYLTRGAFARAAGVSTNTLVAWHKAGTLIPAQVDPVNGYRYYTPEQVAQVRGARQRRPRSR
jgi:hypothetical protein